MQLVVHAQPGPRQQRADGVGADPQHERDLAVAQPLETGQGEGGTLLRAQARRRGRQAGRRPLAAFGGAPEQLVARRARGAEDGEAEALAGALQAPQLRMGEQERVLGCVRRGLGSPQHPPAEREDARAVGVPQRGGGRGIPRRRRPHQLRLAARPAHGAASYAARRAA